MPDGVFSDFEGFGARMFSNWFFGQQPKAQPTNPYIRRIPNWNPTDPIPQAPRSFDPGKYRLNLGQPMANDVVSAAMQQTFGSGGSYFPAANQKLFASNERTDLLNQIEGTFYGGGQSNPTPTPTPTTSPIKPTQMGLNDLMKYFGVASAPARDMTETPLWMNKPDNQIWRPGFGYT